MADLDNPSDTSGNMIAASAVTGTSVYDRQGEKLGSIADVMLNKISGQTEYAILNFGGLFGLGGHHHPLPWHVLRYDPQLGGYVVDLDRRRLEGAPAYENSDANWNDSGWGRRVDDYYGAPTHEDLVSGSTTPSLGGTVPLV
jgi:sporulation protein YlmC with PRC-barrel domain